MARTSIIQRMASRSAAGRRDAVAARERAVDLAVGSVRLGSLIPEPSKKGPIQVEPRLAVTLTTVLACIEAISTGVSGADMAVFDQEERLLDPQPDYPLLHAPDPFRTYTEAIETTTVNLTTYGNAWWRILEWFRGVPWIVEILRDQDVQEMVDPWQNRIIYYHVRAEKVMPADMIHFKGFTFAGYPLGLGPIELTRRTLANAICQDQAAEESLVSGTAARGHFEHAGEPNMKVAAKVRKAWARDTAGRDTTPFVVPGDLRWVTDTMNPADLQLLESRQFSQREICTMFRVPPSLIGVPSTDSKTYSSANMEDRAFAKRSLDPWKNRIASKLTAYLPPGERVMFKKGRLTEPSDLERMKVYQIRHTLKSITPDEIREREGDPPLTAEQKAELNPPKPEMKPGEKPDEKPALGAEKPPPPAKALTAGSAAGRV